MKHRSYDVNYQMYLALCKILSLLGIEPPTVITAEVMERALTNMKALRTVSARIKQYDQIAQPTRKKASPIIHSPFYRDVLVISVHGIVRYQLKAFFEKLNVNAVICDSPYNGLVSFAKKLPDLLILDISVNSNDLSSLVFEMRHVIESHGARTRIVILASPTAVNVKEIYLESGADYFLEKHDHWQLDLVSFLKTSSCQTYTPKSVSSCEDWKDPLSDILNHSRQRYT